MIENIKEAMKEKGVLFGICECIKNIRDIEKIFLSSDARQDTESKIKNIINSAKANATCERLNIKKEDIPKKLDVNFSCEVFSICKKPVERGKKNAKTWGKDKDAKKEKVISGKGNKEYRKTGDKTKS